MTGFLAPGSICHFVYSTNKPVKNGDSKIDKTKILMTNGSSKYSFDLH